MPTDEQDSLVEEYRRYTWRKMLFILVIAVGAVVLIGLSLSAGKRDIGFFEVYDVLYRHLCGFTYEFHSDEWWDDSIVWNTRLPRALMAILVGAVLSICGATMQSVLKNPLADPYTTGVSSASSFGMAIALFLGFSITVPADHYGMMFFAFL
ncbi:MAG: iron ABC transporter permease, partial [archaeon]|nr:iron ABC transporter permease [archaeon]